MTSVTNHIRHHHYLSAAASCTIATSDNLSNSLLSASTLTSGSSGALDDGSGKIDLVEDIASGITASAVSLQGDRGSMGDILPLVPPLIDDLGIEYEWNGNKMGC